MTRSDAGRSGVSALAARVLDNHRGDLASPREPTALAHAPRTGVPILEVRDVDFSYGRVQVLFGVDLAVHAGETVALLGSNGAGKSTLLRVISGLELPARGAVALHGRSITGTPAEGRVRLGITQLSGGHATFPPLTVAENLRVGAYRYSRADAKRRVESALDPFPMLAKRRDAKAGDLSGGQQHMLALAMALLQDPDVLLIDELSLGLAPMVTQQVLDVVRDLKVRGMTMVIVEQSLDIALALADNAVFIEKGAVRFSGTSNELAQRDDLVHAAFFGT